MTIPNFPTKNEVVEFNKEERRRAADEAHDANQQCGDEKCQECCEHDEHDHFICMYCDKELDPGHYIEQAMRHYED